MNLEIPNGKRFDEFPELTDQQLKDADIFLVKPADGTGIRKITKANLALKMREGLVNPNLLDNWYFGNPVNQRGKTEYTNQYSIDRWFAEGNVKIENGGISIGGNNPLIQRQDKTFVSNILGQKVTVSILLSDGTLGSDTVVIPAVEPSEFTVFLNKKVGNVSVMLSLGSIDSQRQFPRIHADTNQTASIKAVKLELGSHQTLAHQENGKWVLNEIPDYGEQLRRCQRYYWESKGYITLIAVGKEADTGLCCNVNFPVTMRSTPSIVLTNAYGKKDTMMFMWTGMDVEGTVTANPLGITCDGLSIVNSSILVDNTMRYRAKIIASAEL